MRVAILAVVPQTNASGNTSAWSTCLPKKNVLTMHASVWIAKLTWQLIFKNVHEEEAG